MIAEPTGHICNIWWHGHEHVAMMRMITTELHSLAGVGDLLPGVHVRHYGGICLTHINTVDW